MTILKSVYPPLPVASLRGVNARNQHAALCYRIVKDKPQILLITSRDTGRWIIPKGWPKKKVKPFEAAAEEAWEEAGVEGRAQDHLLGYYAYTKRMGKGDGLPCMVSVHPIKVQRLHDDFPEAGQRRRKWFSPKKASSKVIEPELGEILLHFDPTRLKGK